MTIPTSSKEYFSTQKGSGDENKVEWMGFDVVIPSGYLPAAALPCSLRYHPNKDQTDLILVPLAHQETHQVTHGALEATPSRRSVVERFSLKTIVLFFKPHDTPDAMIPDSMRSHFQSLLKWGKPTHCPLCSEHRPHAVYRLSYRPSKTASSPPTNAALFAPTSAIFLADRVEGIDPSGRIRRAGNGGKHS